MCTAVIFWFTRDAAIEDLKKRFQLYAEEHIDIIENELNLNLNHLEALQLHMAQSGKISRDEFNRFVDPWVNLKSIKALEWIPRVPSSQRAAYEQEARKDGLKDFRITEKDNRGQFIPAQSRAEYFPVYFLEPLEGNNKALGFDLASDPQRRQTLEKARDTAHPAVTERVFL
ncbi:MAG TPA: CHASE domain-containing protein, partial [Thermodesulfobacteriota bacterium]|nr:CHASE domain-containing protein [Thermodesulfobacteriota bacterium]